ncbi:substrate-binding periplasmic protein [Niveibacterium sp.]|uniref:substrate-binding periplasmic protein n=1 Tax=Niveibacterium sp. TaxID=2017444 RepID=UPI0035B26462
MLHRVLLLLAALFAMPAVAGDIRFPGGDTPEDKRWDFVLEILALSLQKAPAGDTPDRIVRLPAQMQARRIAELSSGHLDVAVAIGSRDLVRQPVIFIPLPLQRGLLGWRLLLANAEGARKLAHVQSLDDLRPLRMGFVRTFADYPVMLANQLRVVDGADYQGMFKMLKAGRMDYLSRGVGEIFAEHEALRERGNSTLVIEPRLALHYRADWFFVVNPARRDLAERITRGLEQARRDGSYERVFQQHFAPVLAQARLDQRRIIELANPDFPELDNQIPSNWWWMPERGRSSAGEAQKPH